MVFSCGKLGRQTTSGEGNDKRLTGKHETCDINTFKHLGGRGRGEGLKGVRGLGLSA